MKSRSNTYRIGMTFFLSAWCGLEVAYAQRGATFSQHTHIPSEGVTFRVMRGAEPVGLPQPTVYHYRMFDGSTLEKFVPRDLWFPGVFLGQWQDSTELTLIMGVLRPPPPPFPRDHASRDEYAAALQSSRPKTPDTVEALYEWLRLFAGIKPVGEPRSLRPSPRLHTALAIDFAHADHTRLGYVFRFNPNVHQVDPDQWYVALFILPLGADTDAITRSIEEGFIGSLGTMAKLDDPSQRAAVRFQHAGLAADTDEKRSPAFIESRERAIHSIRGLPGWWFVETPNYVLVSDLRGGQRSFVRRLQEELESMRAFTESFTDFWLSDRRRHRARRNHDLL